MNRGSLTIGEFGDTRAGRLAKRRRPAFNWLRLGLVCVAVLLALAAAFYGTRWLRTTPRFAVTRIETSRYRYTDRVALDALLEEYLRVNLWTLSPGRMALEIEKLPWVHRVQVSRRLPGTVQVHFDEWRPIAQLAASGDPADFVLENGTVARLTSSQPAPGLPVLVGLRAAAADSNGTRRLAEPQGAAVGDLLAAVADCGLESVSPVDFVLVDELGCTLVLRDGGPRLILGREDFARRIRTYLAAHDEVAGAGTVDLRFRNRISVD